MGSARANLIPLPVKLALVAWLLVWMPLRAAAFPAISWLSFCAYGAVILVAGVVLENRLLVSWQAVALVVAQTAYVVDASWGGRSTAYLFDGAVPFAIRSLSLFHFVLPLVALDAVRRLGYDPRALPLQVATAAVVLPLLYATDPRALGLGTAFRVEGRAPLPTLVALFVVLVTFCYAPIHAIFSGCSFTSSPTSRRSRALPER